MSWPPEHSVQASSLDEATAAALQAVSSPRRLEAGLPSRPASRGH